MPQSLHNKHFSLHFRFFMTIVVFITYVVFFLKQASKNFYFVVSNLEFIACSVLIQTLIVSKQLQVFHNYATKISESRNLLY